MDDDLVSVLCGVGSFIDFVSVGAGKKKSGVGIAGVTRV